MRGERLESGVARRMELSSPTAPARGDLPGWYPELHSGIPRAASGDHCGQQGIAGHQLGRSAPTSSRGRTSRVGAPRSSTDFRAICGKDSQNARGFSARNLKYMRAFAAAWPDPSIVQRSTAQLPWRHHIALISIGTATCSTKSTPSRPPRRHPRPHSARPSPAPPCRPARRRTSPTPQRTVRQLEKATVRSAR